jgi:hypothetical protein
VFCFFVEYDFFHLPIRFAGYFPVTFFVPKKVTKKVHRRRLSRRCGRDVPHTGGGRFPD